MSVLFDLKVLDPAMGSGHFLVTAVDFVADRLLHFLNGFPGNPVQRLLSQTRQQILKELPEGVIVDESRLTDVNLLKRHVLKRCVYGVDLNRMAVELAKVSLWLHCFTLGAPLSFLDHHLKWGNSLIGEVSTAEVSAAEGAQAPLGGMSRWDQFTKAVRDYLTVSQLSDASAKQVLASRAFFREAEGILRPHREELNILTARHFAGWKDKEVGQAQAAATPEGQKLFRQAQDLAEEHRFFQWPLEFPEVWYGVRAGTERVVARKAEGEAGFDAVVGNPPWLGVRTGTVDAAPLAAVRARFATCIGQFDYAAVFMELGVQLASIGGHLAMVIPKRIATNEAHAALRQLLTHDRYLSSVADLGVAFEDVNNDVMILVSAPPTARRPTFQIGVRVSREDVLWHQASAALLDGMPFGVIPLNTHPGVLEIVLGIARGPVVELGDVAEITRGAECGMNHPAISTRQLATSIPLVDHLDFDRYRLEHSGHFVDTASIEPEVLKSADVYTRTPKLLARFLSAQLVVARDDTGYASTNLAYHIHCGMDVDFTTAILSSNLLNLWYRNCFQNEEVKFPHVQKSHLVRIPVRIVDAAHNSSPEAKQNLLSSSASALDSGDYDTPLALASQALAAHAALHGPAGKPELRDDPYWREAIAGADTSFPGREDFVHDLLASLAQRMMDLNRDKYAEIDRFVAWLERELGIEVEDLTRKTHIKGYAEADFPRLQEALQANRRKLALPVDGLFGAQLREEYGQSMARLRPLQEALTNTDRLIDQIVYRLYGLTEEEIAVVEGSNAG